MDFPQVFHGCDFMVYKPTRVWVFHGYITQQKRYEDMVSIIDSI